MYARQSYHGLVAKPSYLHRVLRQVVAHHVEVIEMIAVDELHQFSGGTVEEIPNVSHVSC